MRKIFNYFNQSYFLIKFLFVKIDTREKLVEGQISEN